LQNEFAKFVGTIAESLALIGETSSCPPQSTLDLLVKLAFKVRPGTASCTALRCTHRCWCHAVDGVSSTAWWW
jgi:hypothetical protein